MISIIGTAAALAQTAPGTNIDNTAVGRYSVGGISNLSVSSNRVRTVTVELRTPADIEILQYAPARPDAEMVPVDLTDYSTDGTTAGIFTVLPPPVPPGRVQPLDLSQPLPLLPTALVHQGSPLFLRMTDLDQNRDPGLVESVFVYLHVKPAGETMLIRLLETGSDTGRFTGYVQSSGDVARRAFDTMLNVAPLFEVFAGYVDLNDPSDSVEARALVDPGGLVFDTGDGRPVDGVAVTLVNTATGQPAVVFGDDGQSVFPSTVTTGGTVTDSSGRTYDFGPGRYRFPFVVPGSYRLEVEGPRTYIWPTRRTDAELAAVPGGPYAVAVPGSRGEDFDLNPGPALQVDLPLDPIPTTDQLALTKTADRDLVAHGDFLQYSLHLENRGEGLALNTVVTDHLPAGFRFREGSAALIDGGALAPAIASDGRTLVFDLGDVPLGDVVDFHYVVEVAAGTPAGEAVSVARATAEAGVRSGDAVVRTTIREAFLRNSGIITGRVVVGDCEQDQIGERQGVPGVRLFLEDGTFTVTDDGGRYHFEGLDPGAHVVQVDLESLPERHAPLACLDDSRAAGRAYSRFVDLQGGTVWRAEFHLSFTPEPIPQGEVTLELATALTGTKLAGRVKITPAEVPLEGLRLMVVLPEGVVYDPGSSHLGDEVVSDPALEDNMLFFDLGEAAPDSVIGLRFTTQLTWVGEGRDLPVGAQLSYVMPNGETGRTEPVRTKLKLALDEMLAPKPDVVLRPRFETFSADIHPSEFEELRQVAELLRSRQVLHMHVAGHSDDVPISARGQKTWSDNYVLSLARARAVGEFLGGILGLGPEQITLEGRGPDEPVASNAIREGRRMNRRVELRVVTAERSLKASDQSVMAMADVSARTTGIRPSEAKRRAEETTGDPDVPTMPTFDDTWLETVDPGTAWLWPTAEFRPSAPSTRVVVQHHPDQQVELRLNGRQLPMVHLEAVRENSAGTVAVTGWRGIDLQEGENDFVAIIMDSAGSEIRRLNHTVHYASPPVLATFLADQSSLVADGQVNPVVAVRLTDREGQPAREGVIGEFTIEPPYRAAQEHEAFLRNPLIGLNRERTTYVIGPDGVAFIPIDRTTRTGEGVLRFQFRNHEQEIRIWFEPAPRDWILVGIAEGTLGYSTLSGNMESLGSDTPEDRWYDEGRVAFYAKGAIKGKWLATIAYDTRKSRDADQEQLYQEIDPDQYFTIYGDGTQQDYDASSARQLFVKLERRQFYALFGDFDTGLTVNELARYSRSFNGFKSELNGKNVGFNVFASQTGHGFHRDEIRGDGTSGLYHLTRPELVINSEKVAIEVRDRYRSEVVLSTRVLARHLDYSIDYDAGTLLFKAPVPSKDDNLNPIYIVADYEVRDTDANYNNFGGRGALKTNNEKLEVGSTFVRQEDATGRGDLLGWDGRYRFTQQTELKGEYVITDTDGAGRHRAWLGEFKNTAGRFNGRAYWRVNEEGFGLGHQNRTEAGTRKFGADLDFRLSSLLSFKSQLWRQDNLGNGARRDHVEGRLQWRDSIFKAHAGARQARDRFVDIPDRVSTQLTAGAAVSTRNRKFTLSADHEQALRGRDNSVDFPTRTILGADYELVRNLDLLTRYEWTNGQAGNTQGARVGLASRPWGGAEITSTYEKKFNENGERAFANLGARQLWRVSKKWSLDVGVDHSQATDGATVPRPNEAVPPVSGTTTGFTAYSTGVAYRSKLWQWNTRFEVRNSDPEDKWSITPAVLIEPRSGLGLAGRARVMSSEGAGDSRWRTIDVRLGLALRPEREGWVILDRLDWVSDDRLTTKVDLSGWRIVNHLNLTYFSGRNTQIALQYGAKYNRDDIAGSRYTGYTDLIGGEVRQNLSRRLDMGLRLSGLHSWSAKQIEYGAGASVGINLMTNTWLSGGYNLKGFHDPDFSAANFTAKGPFVQVRFKFDQESAGEILKVFMGGGYE